MVKFTKSSALIALSSVLLSSTFLAFLFLTSFNASAADSIIDNVALSVQVSCNISSTLNSAHTDRVSNGTYKEDIGITTLKVTCNDNDGFAIYAAGYTGDEIGGTNSTKLVNSNTDTISTGLSLTGNDSQWAMKLETDSNATYPVTLDSDTNGSFGSYHIIPSTYTKVAHRDGLTDIGINAVGAVLTTTYRAYAAPEQPSGTYNGKVIYTVVHPANEIPLHEETTAAGKICYYPNGGMVLGSMGCQTIPSSGGDADTVTPTSATLLASNFSREGYGFAGWSTTYDYSDPTGFYGPQEYITFTAGTYSGSNPGLSLYAHWIKSAGSLQEWSGCSALQEGAVTALTDQRDNETYAVAKLADEKCWMIENLRLENNTADNATGALAQGYKTGFTGLANPEAPWSTSSDYTTANSLYSIDGSTANTISGSSPAYRFPRYNNVNTPTAQNVSDRPSNPTTNGTTNSTSKAGMYSYGNYYTWAAATTNTTATSTNDYNTKSICPKGWSLPRGGNKSREATNDFWSLIVTGLNGGTKPSNYDSSTNPYYYGPTEKAPVSNALRAYPNNFVYSGYINSGSAGNRGSYGYYWSSTANGSNDAYYLNLGSSGVYPGTSSYNKFFGRTIRCIVPSA